MAGLEEAVGFTPEPFSFLHSTIPARTTQPDCVGREEEMEFLQFKGLGDFSRPSLSKRPGVAQNFRAAMIIIFLFMNPIYMLIQETLDGKQDKPSQKNPFIKAH